MDWVIEASLEVMRDAGATAVDVHLPGWLLRASGDLYTTVRHRKCRTQIRDSLATLKPGFAKNLAELVEQSVRLTAPIDHVQPNPGRWRLFRREEESGTLSDYEYRAAREHGLPMVRTIIEGVIASEDLDAIVYPTSPRRPARALLSGSGLRRTASARVGLRI